MESIWIPSSDFWRNSVDDGHFQQEGAKNGPFIDGLTWVYLLKMVIFHGYVK